MSTSFLTQQLSPDGVLYVEVAWGADLTSVAAAASWVWTDITSDVMVADGRKIAITTCRQDESATTQPAKCRLRLKNATGAYSKGPQSSNWPNVRRSTPVRVRIDRGDGTPVRVFQGYADGWTPRWDTTGNFAAVDLAASGILRRLIQGDSPVTSSIRRALTSLANVVAYWPAEDLKNSTSIASAIPGVLPMTMAQRPDFEASTVFDCSRPLPEMNNAQFLGTVPDYDASAGEHQVRFLATFPTSGLTDTAKILRVFTTGTAAIWDIQYDTGGALEINVFNSDWGTIYDGIAYAFAVDGTAVRMNLSMTQNGANIDWEFSTYVVGSTAAGLAGTSGAGGVITGTLAGNTIGKIRNLEVVPNINLDNIGLGHFSVQNQVTSFYADDEDADAFAGETADDRLTRLCAENNIPLTLVGSSDIKMGPQTAEALVALLRECESADQGILADGLGPGITYICRDSIENAAASLTLNAAAFQLASFDPEDDDQRNRNKVTATRKRGSSYTHEDVTGPLGTDAVGIYDHAVTINVESDYQIADYAGWLVHLGTDEGSGYRLPALEFAFHHDPALIPSWLGILPGTRIDVTNIATARSQHPAGDVSLLLEGYYQEIDKFTWSVKANCSPFNPWRIAVIAAETGDTGENLWRLSGEGSALSSGASAGATSLSVATPAGGALWTTTADDFPLYIEVGGIKVTVTAISGASSPQTFTVTGATVTKALASGLDVDVWRPPVLGL